MKLSGDEIYDSKDGQWTICQYVLQQYFEVPDNAKSIQFFAYAKPAKDRVPVELEYDENGITIFTDGEIEFFMGATDMLIINLLERHGGKFYVECEYE